MKAFTVGHKECHDEIFPSHGQGSTPVKPTDDDKKEMMKKYQENSMCFEVCTMKKQKMLNADGTYNVAETEKTIKSAFPARVQAELKKAFDECATTNGKSFSMDNKCAGYQAFRDCKAKKFMEICQIKHHKSSEESSA